MTSILGDPIGTKGKRSTPTSRFQDNLFNEFVPTIRKDCRAFLKETKSCKKFLYRAFNPDEPEYGFEIRTPRKDRVPTDTPKRVQMAFDNAYEEVYGWRPRQTGVFCSSDIGGTYGYGWSHYIFPVGKYRYMWHPDVRDFFITQGRIGPINRFNDIQLLGEMMTLVKGYKDSKQLCRALGASYSQEIILGCKKYYGVLWKGVKNQQPKDIEKEFIKALWG
jgi:hypothetical protein